MTVMVFGSIAFPHLLVVPAEPGIQEHAQSKPLWIAGQARR